VCVVDGNWSAFEHTLTPLDSGGLNSSFLSLAPWNNGNEAPKGECHISSVPDIEKKHFRVSEIMPEQIPVSVSDVNSSRSPFYCVSTSPGIIDINNDGSTAGVKPSFVGSEFLTNNYSDVISVTSATQMPKDVYCQVVGSRQMVGEHNVKCSQCASQTADEIDINRHARGKENVQPLVDRSDVPKINARKWLDSENESVDRCAGTNALSTTTKHSIQHTKNQGSESLNQWRSPLRLSVNNVRNIHSTQSQLFPRDSHGEHVVTNDAFSALTFVSNDSFDSYVDQHSPSKFSDDGLNSEAAGIHKRSSSTPVKDQTLQEPVRFRRQQRSSSPEKANRKQRKSSTQRLSDKTLPAAEVTVPVKRLNEQSSTEQNARRMIAQPDNRGVGTNAVLTERLSSGVLSTGSLSDDSLVIADMTYESTVLMSLPACVNVESADALQDTSCPEVGTQTSLLLHSKDSKTNSPLISGNR